MHTRPAKPGPEDGRGTDVAEPLAPEALAAERPWEGSEPLIVVNLRRKPRDAL